MQADRVQQEREAFQAFLLREGWKRIDLARDDGDYYASASVRAMWAGWLMRAKHAAGASEAGHHTFSQHTPVNSGEGGKQDGGEKG